MDGQARVGTDIALPSPAGTMANRTSASSPGSTMEPSPFWSRRWS
ncbi:MAG TPA: hypothetical protein VF432_15340 [Thermoanaerobaculia bacterium]